jgi:hypothetical protein
MKEKYNEAKEKTRRKGGEKGIMGRNRKNRTRRERE